MRYKIIVIGLFITVLFLTGCATPNRDTGILVKEGKVTKIDYDIIFGGTFTDWRDEIFFDDGSMLMIKDSDLSIIELNRTGVFRFRKNYFDYDGHRYKFHKLLGVEYENN